MKFLASEIVELLHAVRSPGAREHVAVVRRYLISFMLMLAAFSTIFHFLMLAEGQHHSWLTGLYWTLTVMSTLGFGDITFTSDLGRLFSIIVLISGVFFLLIILPFIFIQHLYEPWMERQKREMVPSRVSRDTRGHIIISGTDPIALNLARNLSHYGLRAIVLCGDTQLGMKLINQGYDVVVGEYDDKETYLNLNVTEAAILIVMETDVRSTNIVFSTREVAPNLTIVAGIEKMAARDILRMAGCSRVFHFYSLLGETLARRVIKPSHRVSEVCRISSIVIAEAPVMRTPLQGKTLKQSDVRRTTGVNIVGVWERGVFSLPRLNTVFSQSTVLMVAGSPEQVEAFNHLLSSSDKASEENRPPTIILGGGRVGQAVARSLARRNISCIIVDKKPEVYNQNVTVIHGDASDLTVLEKAGLRETPSIVVTTHDDDANIYLTLYCRRLRPDTQIISRASVDRNVTGLHMAGADQVLSLASLVSNTMVNLLSPDRVIMINERLSAFRSTAGNTLTGKRLMDSHIREETGCSVIGVHSVDGSIYANPDPHYLFAAGDKIYLIGDTNGQAAFRRLHGIDADFARQQDSDWEHPRRT